MSYVLEMDFSKWIYGFLWSGRGESRERGLPPKEIYISASDQTNTSRLGFGPPPYYSYEMVLFFSTTNFAQKNKTKKQKKSKRVGGRVIIIFTFFHARTHTHARKHVVCCE